MSESHKWFYVRAGFSGDETLGPLTTEQMTNLVLKGKIKCKTKVNKAGSKKWMELRHANEITLAIEQAKQKANLERETLAEERRLAAEKKKAEQAEQKLLATKSKKEAIAKENIKKAPWPSVLGFGTVGLVAITLLIWGFVALIGMTNNQQELATSSDKVDAASRTNSAEKGTPVIKSSDDGSKNEPIVQNKDENNPAKKLEKLDLTQLYKQTVESVIHIRAKNESGKTFASGSGFLVDFDPPFKSSAPNTVLADYQKHLDRLERNCIARLAITNFHVIRGAVSADVEFKDGSQGKIEHVIAEDRIKDLAIVIVAINGRQLSGPPLLKIAASNPEPGQDVYTIGSPKGLRFSFTSGIVNAIRSDESRGTIIQTQTPISPGSSGGPLIDEMGTVLGVVKSRYVDGQNLNFAVSCVEIQSLMNKCDPYHFSIGRRIAEGCSVADALANEVLRLKSFLDDETEIEKGKTPLRKLIFALNEK